MMRQIQWDFHRLLINESCRQHFLVIQKSKREISAFHFLKSWCIAQSKPAKLFIVSIITAHWYAVFELSIFFLLGNKLTEQFRSITQNFFIEFSKKSGPCLLSRSVLQCLYVPQPNLVFGVTPVTDMLRDSVKLFCAPTSLVLRNNFTGSAQVRNNKPFTCPEMCRK